MVVHDLHIVKVRAAIELSYPGSEVERSAPLSRCATRPILDAGLAFVDAYDNTTVTIPL